MASSVSGPTPLAFNPPRGLRVNVGMNIRAQPTRGSLRVSRAAPDARLQAEALVSGERYLEQDLWFRLVGGREFVWAGGVSVVEAGLAAPAAGGVTDVTRRGDGTIKPLTVSEIESVYGAFAHAPASQRGFINIEAGWIGNNIVSLATPLLQHLGFPAIRVHARARPHFAAVFDEIARQQLGEQLLSCGGTFVPRHISRDPSRPLSSHSWGIAIDLNAEWNGYGARPALPGLLGSVHDLVPIFAAHGFAWGGHFSTPDGMHFELARHHP